jgi:GT2 family glycosyltransferase
VKKTQHVMGSHDQPACAGVSGFREAVTQGAQYVWILNNDTVVDCRALGYLVERMSLDHTIGLCGCTLLEYLDPHLVQAASGAHYDYRTTRTKNCGRGLTANARLDTCRVEKSITYVAGASVMAIRAYLQDVGLMNECYFLYFEELDWAIWGKRRGFQLGYASDALVYHKQGASTGSKESNLLPLPCAQYFYARNLLLMTASFYRPWYFLIWMKIMGTAVKYFLMGHLVLAKATCLGVLNLGLAEDLDHVRDRLSSDGSPVRGRQTGWRN